MSAETGHCLVSRYRQQLPDSVGRMWSAVASGNIRNNETFTSVVYYDTLRQYEPDLSAVHRLGSFSIRSFLGGPRPT